MKKVLAIIGYITVIFGLLHEAFSIISGRLVSFTDYCKNQGITFETGNRDKSSISQNQVSKPDPLSNSAK